MKKTSFLFLLVLLLTAGCASSDRMVRMSGGVFDEYKAPPSYRVRSERFQQKSSDLSASNKNRQSKIGDFDSPLVNIWPFYFRSNNYFSILWPFIDWDAYGMAIRPFYNQEGDEYSVLFPLSAWNPVSKDGWFLNFAWTKHGFGFVPLSWQSDDDKEFWYYYTPFLIYSKDKEPLAWKNVYCRDTKDESFFLFMLGYRDVNLCADTSGAGQMLRGSYNRRRYLAKKYGYEAPPKKNDEAWKRKLFATLPRYREYGYGFFPLFHYSTDSRGNQWDWRAFCYLAGASRRNKNFNWDVLTPLVMNYSHHEYTDPQSYTRSLTEFWALPLLTVYEKKVVYLDQPERKILDAADKTLNGSYGQNRPLVEEFLKKHSPGTTIPDTVVDDETLRLFINDWKAEYSKKKTFRTATRTGGGFLPLLCAWDEKDLQKSGFFSLATMTRYSKDKHGYNFWSLPLLTYVNKDENSSSFCIAPPLIWMDFTEKRERYFLAIHSRDTKDTAAWQCADTADTFAGCGLFYRGKVAFFVAKPGIDHKAAETVRGNLIALPGDVSRLKNREKYYRIEMDKVEKWNPKNKKEYYRKMIRLEELKEVSAEITKLRGQYQDLLNTTLQEAKKIGFNFTESEVQTLDSSKKVIARLYENCAELRWKEDIGSGIIYRKEKFYNGDYKWHFLHFLAGGEKNGTQENVHVLHFLYRKRVDGDKSETLFFPFVSIQKDGQRERVSFLGRVWQKTTENGKSSGYFLFIPW